PGQRLLSPRPDATVPPGLTAEEAAAVMDAARDQVAAAGTPAARARATRDWAVLVLLYATGVRVDELVGTDLSDVNLAERLLRVRGKGDEARMVPFCRPASEAVEHWLGARQHLLPDHAGAPGEMFLGTRGGRLGAP